MTHRCFSATCLQLLAVVGLVSCETERRNFQVGTETLGFENPELGMRMARGYDPDAKEPLRGDCITSPDAFLQTSWKEARGIKAELSETRITSHEELMRELNFSASASVRYKFYKGNANFSKYDKFTSSEDTFTWIFSIRAVSGEATLSLDQISRDSLTDAAKKLVVAGDKEGFRKLCGSQFIRSVKYGGRIANVQEISAKATEQIKKIHADMNAGGSMGVWKASASATYDQAISEAQSRSMLKREYSQEGGTNIHYDLSPNNIQKTLNEFSSALNQNSSVPLEIETADWSTVLNFDSSDLTDIARQQALQRLYKTLWQNNEKLEKIDQYVYLFEGNHAKLNKEQIDEISLKAQDIASQNDDILLKGQACYEDATKCKISGISPIAVGFPQLVMNPVPGIRKAIGQWSVEFPVDVIFTVSSIGTAQGWHSRDPLLLPSVSGAALPVSVEAIVLPNCKGAVDEIRKASNEVLMTNRGEQVPYFEKANPLPDGLYMPQIGFGFEGRNGQCLKLSFYGKSPIVAPFTLSDNSEISRVLRGIAQSVRN